MGEGVRRDEDAARRGGSRGRARPSVTAAAEPLLEGAEAAYRAAWCAATGTASAGDLTGACVGRPLRGDALVQRAERGTTDQLARIPDRDWTWGTTTARGRLVHRLGVVSRLTADRTDLLAVSRLSADLLDRMPARWPRIRPVPSRRP
ncbi:hypothetical protein [uncultured Streptomyces sp.]|uniref:hypothetical protein n=1 Tax=uncultured Streptomyces sp. TaxID=174707 RepID=UPI002603E418|nr:hypothetical protein [uncultured Streptomyces sp.]